MVMNRLNLLKRHAVHPSSPLGACKTISKSDKEPYGPWCSPEIKSEQRSTKCSTRTDPFVTAGSALPKKRTLTEESLIELQEITEIPDTSNVPEKKKSSCNATSSPVETPQSPVPSSPSRAKRCRGFFRIPSIIDPYVPIDPQGRGYITWLLLVTCSYSYNAWCIVLRATFPYQTPSNTATWMTIDYISDVIYLLDLALVKPRLMYLHEGFWVDELKETRKNYRKKLQYKFDVISLLPLDLLYLVVGTRHVILRAPRLLKLQTFWEFHQAMDRLLASPYVVRIGKTLFYIFYLIHLNACAYYAMSAYEGLASNGWVYDNQGNAYIRCFYFATKTATSIGKNPKPENAAEYLFMTAAWLMGVFVFALLIGQIRDIIATATRAKTEYRASVDACSRYLRALSVPARVQRRVNDWYHYTWTQQRCFDESKILNSLPYNMKLDVALEVHMATLSKVQVFRDCSSSLLRDLVLQLRPRACLPGDAVLRRGEPGHHMYIVQAGECCVMSPDETEVLARLRQGSVFGEICLLGLPGMRRRTATVRSRGYSSLFALSRSDLEAALRHHREAHLLLRRRADQIIRENAARQTKQRILERQARKSGSIASSGPRRRRRSSTGSADSRARTDRPDRPDRDLSKTRLEVLSETKGAACESAASSVRSSIRTPLPTIVLSTE